MFGPGLGLVQQDGGDGACVVTTKAKDGRGDVDYDDEGKGDVMGSGDKPWGWRPMGHGHAGHDLPITMQVCFIILHKQNINQLPHRIDHDI